MGPAVAIRRPAGAARDVHSRARESLEDGGRHRADLSPGAKRHTTGAFCYRENQQVTHVAPLRYRLRTTTASVQLRTRAGERPSILA